MVPGCNGFRNRFLFSERLVFLSGDLPSDSNSVGNIPCCPTPTPMKWISYDMDVASNALGGNSSQRREMDVNVGQFRHNSSLLMTRLG